MAMVLIRVMTEILTPKSMNYLSIKWWNLTQFYHIHRIVKTKETNVKIYSPKAYKNNIDFKPLIILHDVQREDIQHKLIIYSFQN